MAYVKAIGSRPCVVLVCISPRIWDVPEGDDKLAQVVISLYNLRAAKSNG
jgi:hypothetical protein